MDKELFNDLLASIKEAKAIHNGEIQAPEVVEFTPEPAKIRRHLRLTQKQFATFVGVKESTLKNWEQGRRKIPAPARTLFKIATKHPEIVLEMATNT